MKALSDCYGIAFVKAAAERERLKPALLAALVGGGAAGALGAANPTAVLGAERKLIQAMGEIPPLRGRAVRMGMKYWERFGKSLFDPAWKVRLRYGGRAAGAGAIMAGSLAALIGRKKD